MVNGCRTVRRAISATASRANEVPTSIISMYDKRKVKMYLIAVEYERELKFLRDVRYGIKLLREKLKNRVAAMNHRQERAASRLG